MENSKEEYVKRMENLKLENRKKMIDALTRQIGENHEKCEELLEETNYDIMSAIKKYYNIEKKEKKKTTNTILFDTMREMLDEASDKYYREKDLNEAKEKILEKYKNLQKEKNASGEYCMNEKKNLESINE